MKLKSSIYNYNMEMEKQNSTAQKKPIQQKKYQKVKNQNDFVFKRYRYEANTILKDSSNQQQHFKTEKSEKLQNESFQPQIIEFQDDIQDQIDYSQAPTTSIEQKQNTYNQNIIKQIPEKLNSTSKEQPKKQSGEIILFDDQDQEQIEQVQNENISSSIPNFYRNNNKNSLENEMVQSYLQFSISPHSPNEIKSLNESLYSQTGLQQTVNSLIKKQIPFSKKKSNKQSKFLQIQRKIQVNQNLRDFQAQEDKDLQNQNLKGVKITSKPFQDDIIIQITDKKLFSTSKIPPGIILKCKLKRQSSFLSALSPQYDLYLQNGLKHIVSAKKYPFRNRQLFKFSNKIGSFQNSVQRSLMANVSHNGYWLVDQPREIQHQKISYLDILIQYQQIDSLKKNREMRVFIPPNLKSYHIGLQFDTPQLNFDWFKQQISLQLINNLKTGNNIQFKKASDKNFVLVDEQDEDYLYLKVQKSSQNVFDVEIQHPLTPMQAMAIIMTRFDAQLK